MASQAIVEYTASDGQSVKLSPAIVTKYIISGNGQVSDKDMFSFMAKCQARQLNPLAGDCYMTTYRNKDGSTSVSVIVGKDYWLRVATQQEDFDGLKAGVVVNRNGELIYREGAIVGSTTEKLVGGWAEVYSKNRTHPSRIEVSLDEYNTGRSLWKSKPATMIRKVALVQALREAYPNKFAGLYDSAEMPENGKPIEAELETVEIAQAPQEQTETKQEQAGQEVSGEPYADEEVLPPADEYMMEDF